jgi:hypothetical protein
MVLPHLTQDHRGHRVLVALLAPQAALRILYAVTIQLLHFGMPAVFENKEKSLLTKMQVPFQLSPIAT